MKTEIEILKELKKLEDVTFPEILDRLASNIMSESYNDAIEDTLDLIVNLGAAIAAKRIILRYLFLMANLLSCCGDEFSLTQALLLSRRCNPGGIKRELIKAVIIYLSFQFMY